MRFIIEKDAAQAILDYLQTQPYKEVFSLIPLLIARGPRNPTGLVPLGVEEPEKEDGDGESLHD